MHEHVQKYMKRAKIIKQHEKCRIFFRRRRAVGLCRSRRGRRRGGAATWPRRHDERGVCRALREELREAIDGRWWAMVDRRWAAGGGPVLGCGIRIARNAQCQRIGGASHLRKGKRTHVAAMGDLDLERMRGSARGTRCT